MLWSGSEWSPVDDFCAHCNEPLGFIKAGNFLFNYELFTEGPVYSHQYVFFSNHGLGAGRSKSSWFE
jgi:hypothetical protein